MGWLQAETLRLVREEEKATLEAQSLPLRNYLMKFVMPTLTEGLVEVCKVKPDDPVDYLVRLTYIAYTCLVVPFRAQHSRAVCRLLPLYRLNICSSAILRLTDLCFSIVLHTEQLTGAFTRQGCILYYIHMT